jgi:urease accessory protein
MSTTLGCLTITLRLYVYKIVGKYSLTFRFCHIQVPIGLMKNSFTPKTVPSEGVQQTSSGIGKISPLTLYQLIDSCVPSGGFAHSNTLEVAHQLNLLKCIHSSWTESLREHCFDVLLQTFTTTVPFLLEACNLFRTHYHKGQVSKTSEELQPPTKEILRRWETLDVELRATISSHVASRASTTQGSGLLRAFSASFSDIAPVIKALRRQIIIMSPSQTSDCCGHAATCFGAVCGLLDVNNETCVSMFLYTTARDMVNAAVRMNLVGPLEGGFVTNELCTGIDELIQTHLIDLVDCEDTNQLVNTNIAHQVAPLIEVLSNAHDRLYTRLFNS